MKISLITIVNKEKVFDTFKRELKKQQYVDYELIKVNNDSNQFDSAGAALNRGASLAHGEYLVFLHPDIRFLDNYALKSIVDYLKKINDFGVIGVAGCPSMDQGNKILTNIVQGINKEKVGSTICKLEEVQTVDECFFIEKRTYFEKNHFSESKGWHLYAVKQCLNAILKGKINYVVPADLWHLSPGNSENMDYVKIGIRMAKKYKNEFSTINTTVEKWYTSGVKSIYMPWFNFAMHKGKRWLSNYPNLYSKIKNIYFKLERNSEYK